MSLSRIWATKYGIFEVRKGSVTCAELQKPTCHGEKWGCKGCCSCHGEEWVRHGCCANNIDLHHGEKWVCHGSGLQNMIFLT